MILAEGGNGSGRGGKLDWDVACDWGGMGRDGEGKREGGDGRYRVLCSLEIVALVVVRWVAGMYRRCRLCVWEGRGIWA